MMNKSGRRGRRPGSPATKAAVLEVARRRFLAEGYNAVTMRSIAAEAGVDAALISYFFGSKRGLFAAVLALSANPADKLRRAIEGDPATFPERVLKALLETWDDEEHGAQLRIAVRAAMQDPEHGRLLREAIEREVFETFVSFVGGASARRRSAAVATQLAGVVFARYILEIAPIATMPADELVRALAPGIRAVLTPPAGRAVSVRP
jgi:AcrR family transcriptional regulator